MIELRYGLDGATAATLGEIGGRIGITRERVRQIEKEALAILNTLPEAECLRSEPSLSPRRPPTAASATTQTMKAGGRRHDCSKPDVRDAVRVPADRDP